MLGSTERQAARRGFAGGCLDQALKEYELVYIVSPRVAADTVASVIDRVSAIVTDGGGEVLSTDNWGRRRLAYPIKRFFEGTYVVNTLRMPAAQAKPLESALEISEEVLRHLLTNGIIQQPTRRGDRRDDDRERPAPMSEAAAEPMAVASMAAPVMPEAPVAMSAPVAPEAPAAAMAAERTMEPAAPAEAVAADAPAAPADDASRDEAPALAASADAGTADS